MIATDNAVLFANAKSNANMYITEVAVHRYMYISLSPNYRHMYLF